MLIKECKGYELEKEKSNTSEDFFNRSEVAFQEDGEDKVLHVLYVRYFDELYQEFTPFLQNPLFVSDGREVAFKDIVALVCLLKNPSLRHRKRLYISSKQELSAYFQDVDFEKLPSIFEAIVKKNGFDLTSPLNFINQPN